MPRFHPLVVTDVKKTTRDAVVVSLQPETAQLADFEFRPGQYLTFRREIEGEDVRRSYSICAGADDGVLQVAIKRVEGGIFSQWANDALRVGEVIEAMSPIGRFGVELSTSERRHYLAFAAGSGITPILSILKSVLSREPQSQFTLIYANRGVSTIMFRDTLEDLKNLYLGRLSVVHILKTDAQEIDLFCGRVTREKCAELFKHWIDLQSVDLAFICGPKAMMEGVRSSLCDHGMAEDQIRFELFKTNRPTRATRPTVITSDAEETKAVITLDGTSREIAMATGQTLLEAALAHDLDAPFACKAGVCSSCRAKVLDGEVEMIANHALEDYEVAQGYVLTCQCLAVSQKIVVDYDQ
ncbi:MAG: phenylacetate-CoA oxygenase/reductase subunit PaaK [Alphaproteobacteria bacterium]|nr:phenylacetate-CoA oxygenase/reductase subunit PaaK [Alphaproteobacteria bacterium]